MTTGSCDMMMRMRDVSVEREVLVPREAERRVLVCRLTDVSLLHVPSFHSRILLSLFMNGRLAEVVCAYDVGRGEHAVTPHSQSCCEYYSLRIPLPFKVLSSVSVSGSSRLRTEFHSLIPLLSLRIPWPFSSGQ